MANVTYTKYLITFNERGTAIDYLCNNYDEAFYLLVEAKDDNFADVLEIIEIKRDGANVTATDATESLIELIKG